MRVVAAPPHLPSFPEGYRPGIGIVGCGGIVHLAHLPAYTKYGLRVVGVTDSTAGTIDGIRERFPIVEEVFEGLDALLERPEVEIVDIATHADVRAELVQRALEAGKHVLSQKPFALDVATARRLIEEADRRGVRLAVNQNARWAAPWRVATLLVEQGTIGDVCAVTHLYEHDFDWTIGTAYDEMEHFVLYDFSMHWLDITRCWLSEKTVSAVRAVEYRTPAQRPGQSAPWGLWVVVEYEDGSNALIRSVGTATERAGNPFWIHGSEGTIRGSIRKGTDFVEMQRSGSTVRFQLEGEWLPDGFAGAMAELCTAIAEDREPYNSARHNLLSLQTTLAACRSAEEDGRPVALDEVG